MRIVYKVAIAMGAWSLATAAMGHHSAAMFDTSKCLSITGSVRNFQWMNPHSWVWVTTPGSNGATDIWGLEIPAPSQLVALDPRWSHNTILKGDKVTITFSPLKDGRRGGLANTIKLPNGTIMHGAPNAVQCEGANWHGLSGAKK
jgi:Family of unknown function (DUF6152)